MNVSQLLHCTLTIICTTLSHKIVIVHLMKRHCGVLGLAALVEAYPYSVPMWLPEVMDELAVHLHDPAPIAVSLLRGIGY